MSFERIELMKDGRIAYRLKTPRRGKTHRVMTPVELLARLAILVPPPTSRWGVTMASSPRARRGGRVTPKPPDGMARRKKKPKACSDDAQAGAPIAAPDPVPRSITPQARANDAAADTVRRAPAPAAALGAPALRALAIASVAPTIITMKHWSRIRGGEL